MVKTKSTKDIPRLKKKYIKDVIPALIQEFSYENPMEAPHINKVVINTGVGEAVQNIKLLDMAVDEIKLLTGQKPVVNKAKKSIAGFKLREGMPIGCKVTLRGDMMYEFLDRLISIALPRIRDFRGINGNSFDGKGNYTLGIKEQLIFPEIKYETVSFIHGFDITIVTSAKSDKEGKALLKLMGMPFRN
uniref:Large ribosomal subunit protein uL5 n=1 Tax=uncultured Nitrospirae bacterium Rifle_16ft_4_minimus_4901 TaxID=1665132 RepID=A0A0H4T8V2_9BACT|nr:50S ribosomal protein L5, large subunit ribosomal protein L5 [uncultured Nitrospirae bacterium Rifle_16ft_4_minimus_4901]